MKKNKKYYVNSQPFTLLSIHFQDKILTNVHVLLEYFEDNLRYKWDIEDNIHSPINSSNIMDIIKDFFLL